MSCEFMRGIVVAVQTCYLDRGPHALPERKNYTVHYKEKLQLTRIIQEVLRNNVNGGVLCRFHFSLFLFIFPDFKISDIENQFLGLDEFKRIAEKIQ